MLFRLFFPSKRKWKEDIRRMKEGEKRNLRESTGILYFIYYYFFLFFVRYRENFVWGIFGELWSSEVFYRRTIVLWGLCGEIFHWIVCEMNIEYCKFWVEVSMIKNRVAVKIDICWIGGWKFKGWEVVENQNFI